jgi:hypothetical protein
MTAGQAMSKHEEAAMRSMLHETDFLRWTEEQAALLRAGRLAEADIRNILEEIEDMGKEQKVALQSLFRQILVHLLKLRFSSSPAPRASWVEEISEFRAQAETRLEETPSLSHHAPLLFARAWPQARRGAQKAFEAHGERVALPSDCPYTLEQMMDGDFIPEHKPD